MYIVGQEEKSRHFWGHFVPNLPILAMFHSLVKAPAGVQGAALSSSAGPQLRVGHLLDPQSLAAHQDAR
jgi:hypothetical protein